MKIRNLKYIDPNIFKHDGVMYTLEHLQPMILNILINNETIPIKVEFSPHVFTEKFKNHIHDGSLKIYDSSSYKRSKTDIRAFNKHRYHMSKNLRSIFNKIKDTTKFIDGGESSYIIRGHNYYVFCAFYHSKHSDMFTIKVKSAYTRNRPTRNNGKTSLKRIIERIQIKKHS